MAQMLQEKFSSERHLDITSRHVRLCNRNPSAGFMIGDIQPAIDSLQSANNATNAKAKERAYAYDAVVFCDGGLDNAIQNLFDDCKKFDRESGSAPILTRIFPTGRISDIKEAPLMQEPVYARELLQRISALGPNHTLASHLPALEEKIAASEKAIGIYDTIVKEHAMLTVQEDIAQRKLRDQYQLNYLHAMEKLGKSNAELLFPAITKASKPIEAQVVDQQPAALATSVA